MGWCQRAGSTGTLFSTSSLNGPNLPGLSKITQVYKDTWLTPAPLWKLLQTAVPRASLDLVPFPRPLWDALTIPWPLVGVNFVNPPYSQVEKFMSKALLESKRGVKSILLVSERALQFLPASHNKVRVVDILGRVRFINPYRPAVSREAPFRSYLLCYGEMNTIPPIRTKDGKNFTFDDWQPTLLREATSVDKECWNTIKKFCQVDLMKSGGKMKFVQGGRHFLDQILTKGEARQWRYRLPTDTALLLLILGDEAPHGFTFEARFDTGKKTVVLVSLGPRRAMPVAGPDPTRVRVDLGEKMPMTAMEDHAFYMDNTIVTDDLPPRRRTNAPVCDLFRPLADSDYNLDYNLLAKMMRETGSNDLGLARAAEQAHLGFPIGFDGPPTSVLSGNSSRAYANAPQVHAMLQRDEFNLGFLAGGISLEKTLALDGAKPALSIRGSPMFTVPKTEDKLRLIYHGSYPFGNSVNSFLREPTVPIKLHDARRLRDRLVRLIERNPDKQIWLWSGDISKAYRLVPIDRRDVPLLGFVWFDLSKPLPANWSNPDPADLKVYWYTRAPFGLTTSVYWWHRIARGIRHVFMKMPDLPKVDFDLGNYVDDFFGMVASNDPKLAKKLADKFGQLCEKLRVPLNPKKWSKGKIPKQVLRFIGLEFDAVKRLTRLPVDKLLAGKGRIACALKKKFLRLRDLESLTGVLMYAASVCDYAKLFLRRCFEAIRDTRRLNRRVTPMTQDLRADLKWFLVFWSRLNGRKWRRDLSWTKLQEMNITTDASDTGFGCYNARTGEYIFGRWPPSIQKLPIHILEMLALFGAIAKWGHQWAGKRVVFDVDNMSVVWAFNEFYCKDAGLAIVLREVFLLVQKHNFDLRARHIRTDVNVCSDALSRNKLDLFKLHAFLRHAPSFNTTKLTRVFLSKQVWKVANQILQRRSTPDVHRIPRFFKRARMDNRFVMYQSLGGKRV